MWFKTACIHLLHYESEVSLVPFFEISKQYWRVGCFKGGLMGMSVLIFNKVISHHKSWFLMQRCSQAIFIYVNMHSEL